MSKLQFVVNDIEYSIDYEITNLEIIAIEKKNYLQWKSSITTLTSLCTDIEFVLSLDNIFEMFKQFAINKLDKSVTITFPRAWSENNSLLITIETHVPYTNTNVKNIELHYVNTPFKEKYTNLTNANTTKIDQLETKILELTKENNLIKNQLAKSFILIDNLIETIDNNKLTIDHLLDKNDTINKLISVYNSKLYHLEYIIIDSNNYLIQNNEYTFKAKITKIRNYLSKTVKKNKIKDKVTTNETKNKKLKTQSRVKLIPMSYINRLDEYSVSINDLYEHSLSIMREMESGLVKFSRMYNKINLNDQPNICQSKILKEQHKILNLFTFLFELINNYELTITKINELIDRNKEFRKGIKTSNGPERTYSLVDWVSGPLNIFGKKN